MDETDGYDVTINCRQVSWSPCDVMATPWKVVFERVNSHKDVRNYTLLKSLYFWVWRILFCHQFFPFLVNVKTLMFSKLMTFSKTFKNDDRAAWWAIAYCFRVPQRYEIKFITFFCFKSWQKDKDILAYWLGGLFLNIVMSKLLVLKHPGNSIHLRWYCVLFCCKFVQ